MRNHRDECEDNPVEFLRAAGCAQQSIDKFLQQAIDQVQIRITQHDKEDTQLVRHGLAWQATLTEAMRVMIDWASGLDYDNRLGTLEFNIARVACAELLSQLIHGTPMSQDEFFRPHHLALDDNAWQLAQEPKIKLLLSADCEHLGHQITLEALRRHSIGDSGLDESLQQVASQFRAFANTRIQPFANQWHLNNDLIPDKLIAELGELGVFGITIPEEYGGSGFGKLAMCVVTEELSRGYIGVGSLGTRSEIAAELVQLAGTDSQKDKYLPGIANGTILPAAVFTEPDTGSDLAGLKTRANRLESGAWSINGNKTWITHAARADLMTVLARTDPHEPGYTGLTMFLVDKSRSSTTEEFPDPGLSGSEIDVLAYRGMKEYNLAFDHYEVPVSAALGGVEGQGFKQLMTTFEAARIQTAARAVGVAEQAYELSAHYASERIQFKKPLIRFQRIYGKLARMIVDISIARQLTYRAAGIKDQKIRCDIEAGMAKLYAARTAWSCADNAVQIHGGVGYALDSPVSRVMNDARILSIFEGTAEIQADIISRRLLS